MAKTKKLAKSAKNANETYNVGKQPSSSEDDEPTVQEKSIFDTETDDSQINLSNVDDNVEEEQQVEEEVEEKEEDEEMDDDDDEDEMEEENLKGKKLNKKAPISAPSKAKLQPGKVAKVTKKIPPKETAPAPMSDDDSDEEDSADSEENVKESKIKPTKDLPKNIYKNSVMVDLICQGIEANDDKKGMSVHALKKYIVENDEKNRPWKKLMPQVKRALEKALIDGAIVRPKGSENNSGLQGRFKLDKKIKVKRLSKNSEKAKKSVIKVVKGEKAKETPKINNSKKAEKDKGKASELLKNKKLNSKTLKSDKSEVTAKNTEKESDSKKKSAKNTNVEKKSNKETVKSATTKSKISRKLLELDQIKKNKPEPLHKKSKSGDQNLTVTKTSKSKQRRSKSADQAAQGKKGKTQKVKS